VFELCAETFEACVAAREGGAHRVELCRELSVGGLTPQDELVLSSVRVGLPVHVMVRPRAGGFVYSADELAVMAADVDRMKSLGAAGVVLGVLLADGRVDVSATRRLVELAGPMQVTFHRAFDEAVSLPEALDDVIAAGCGRVLTSGGAPDVVAGAVVLAELVQQAGDRIAVAVGGGLRLENAEAVARVTGAREFHGSLSARGAPKASDVAAMVGCLGGLWG
jgi:copper homeostasis protein